MVKLGRNPPWAPWGGFRPPWSRSSAPPRSQPRAPFHSAPLRSRYAMLRKANSRRTNTLHKKPTRRRAADDGKRFCEVRAARNVSLRVLRALSGIEGESEGERVAGSSLRWSLGGFFFERFPRFYQGISLLRTEQGLIMELLFYRGLTRIFLVNGEQGLNMEISHVALS